LEEIKTATQLNWTELLATAQDRKKWQHIVAGVMANKLINGWQPLTAENAH
jgi:hypothetical protein